MIKRQPLPVLTQDEEFKLQFQSWLYDSHYWIESKPVTTCKWCGVVQPMASNQAFLCMKNPEILKLTTKK